MFNIGLFNDSVSSGVQLTGKSRTIISTTATLEKSDNSLAGKSVTAIRSYGALEVVNSSLSGVSTTVTASRATLINELHLFGKSTTGTRSATFLAVGKRLYGVSPTAVKSTGHIQTMIPLQGKSATKTRSHADLRVRSYKHDPQKYVKSERIFVLDRNEQIVLVLSDDSVPYVSEPGIETELNGDVTLEIDVLATDPRVSRIENDGRLVTRNENGDFMEFIIREIEDDWGDGRYKKVMAEGGEFELIDEFIESYVQSNVSIDDALGTILQGTRYEKGEIDTFYEEKSVELKHMSKRKAINELINMWDGEVRYRVETDGNRVTRRYIDVFKQRGQDTGKRFEAGKDILSTNRVYDSQDVKTAMYGRGASDDEGNRLNFSEVEWRIKDDDPVDKPKGQTWIGDIDALEKWGYEGGRRHKFGFYDGQEEDAAELLLNTWNELQENNKIRDTYEVEVVNLGEILDIPFEKVRLGDRVVVANNEIYPPLHSTASIIKYDHNLNDRKLSKVTLGHFRAELDTDRRVSNIEKDYNDNKGKWDKKPDKIKSELQKEIDDTLDEAQNRIDEAKEKLEKSMENIEVGKEDIKGLEEDLDELEHNISNKIPIGMAAEDVNEGNTKVLGKNLIIDGNTLVTGDIGADGAMFLSVGTRNMLAENATIKNGTITGTFDAPDARIKYAYLENVTITGELNSPTGKFAGEVIADKIKGSEISGVTFMTGTKDSRYVHMEEQEITLYDGNLDKLRIGFKDQDKSLSQKPYIVWGYGKSNGKSVATMEKGSEHFYIDYSAESGKSSLRYNYNGSVALTSASTLLLESSNSIEANNNIYADGFRENSSVKIKDNIKEYTDNATDIINDTPVYTFHMKKDLEGGIYSNKKIGFIAESSPQLNEDGAIGLYRSIAIMWKAMQEKDEEIKGMTDRISDLEEII